MIFDLWLLVIAVVIALVGCGRQRLLALIPAGTLAGIIFYVAAGGPIMLVSWLVAAAVALARPTHPTVA